MKTKSRAEDRKKSGGEIKLKIAYIQGAGGFLSKEDRKRLYNGDEE